MYRRDYKFVEGVTCLVIKNESFNKLAGAVLGNYRLERFIGQSKIGPSFLARTDARSTYLVRFLTGPVDVAPKDYEEYLEHFQYQASQIATLQHPYILPLLDFGSYRGLPYLVSPHIPLRSLRTRIDKNGALNTFTVGRYLDQIATALEYAHEHSVLHGSLSVDSIFIRLDGQLVVADVGVKSLLELNRHNVLVNQLHEWSDGSAPEQLLGKPASPATDVYALGAVVYHLLTGSPVFQGNTLDEIAQLHLYASIPTLTQQRSDLPAGLYSILARALAKDPAQRFHQPGAFANAYHSNLGPMNRTRLPFVVSEAPSALTHQPLVMGVPADIQATEQALNNHTSTATDHMSGSVRLKPQSSNPHSLHGFSGDSLTLADNPRPILMRRFQRKHKQRTILIASLIGLFVVVGGALGITFLAQKSAATSNASGQVTFFSNQKIPGGQTNALNITIHNLTVPPAGYTYEAWIVNDQTEEVIDVGKLTEKSQAWALTYSGASSNLLAAGDKLEVTLEQGVVKVPAGKVILVGTFPVKAFSHIQHLLVSFPKTPGKIGFLIGLLEQTHLLNIQASVLQSVATSRNTIATECVAQSLLDIIEGTQGTHYQPLAEACNQQNVTATGDGFGLLGKGYLTDAEQHAALALSQPDATSGMHQHAALMDIALSNITTWVTTIEHDVLLLRAHPTNLASIQEITSLTDAVYHGIDVNGDGQIDPVVGEAGALSAYLQGQFMATLTLVPSA
jgi:serine/threonine protein kinase